MRFAGWYATVVGILILIQWGFSLATTGVPELQTTPLQIIAHLSAEFATSIVLLASGLAVLNRKTWAAKAYSVASGMLIYAVINSSGYFVQLGRWVFVAIFSLVLVLTLVNLGTIIRTSGA